MHLLYVVPWAECFVHENKSISFYQPSPRRLSVDSEHQVEGKELAEASTLETLATETSTPRS